MPHEYFYRQFKVLSWRVRRFVKYRVLHVDDTPHRIALGVALGFFVAMTPTQGFQCAVVVLLCWMFGANKLAGLPFVWISNPLTFIPIYYPSYRLGVMLTPGADLVTLARWRHEAGLFLRDTHGLWERISLLWSFWMEIAVPLWLGGLISGIVIGVVSYVITRKGIEAYRRRFAHWHPLRRMIRKRLTHEDSEL